MIFKAKNIVLFIAMSLIGWTAWGTYNYFFDHRLPVLHISGLESEGHYAGDMQCSVACIKSGSLSVWLDEQPLISNHSLSSGKEYPFTIPTSTINNGKHAIRAEFIDGTYRKNKTGQDSVFYVDNIPLQAAFVKADGDYKVLQGRTLHLQFQVNKPVKEATLKTLSQAYACFPESENSLIYECYVPVDCDEKPSEYLLTVNVVDHVGNTVQLDSKFQIVLYPFKKQILALSKDKVKEEKTLGMTIAERERVFAELAQASPAQKLWKGSFCTPIDITGIATDFGTIRTTQEKGRYKHKALDVLSMPRSIVWSTQDGIVVLKDRFEDSGNTIVVDHGRGVLSMFYHLEDYANGIQVGQKINQGQPVGTLGMTGYATGYHLHWEMRVNNVAVDPMQWTMSTF